MRSYEDKEPTFIGCNSKIKILVINQYLTVKEERNSMSRSVIVARNCLHIDLPNHYGTYDFSVVLKLSLHLTEIELMARIL